MERSLLVAVLAGLGGMLAWGVADFFAKKTIDQIGDLTTLFWSQSIGIFPLALLLLLSGSSIPSLSPIEWLWLVILGMWSGLSYIPTYVASGKGKSAFSALFLPPMP